MRAAYPRVAYFPDTFYEINGVAHTSRHFEAFAQRRGLPFFCLHPGKRESAVSQQQLGELTTLDIPRGSGLSVRLEKDLTFDPAFLRHRNLLGDKLRAFRPDIVHVTGPSEPGILGAWLAKSLGVPLVASWHTNLHEYAAQRSMWLLRMLPRSHVPAATIRVEQAAGRPCALMPRGVDTLAFSPQHRDRASSDQLVLGFCGRLSIEKNVFLLARIRSELLARGITNFRFLIVGHGKEESWLREHLPNAEFTGVLRGPELARAYANMDVFVFPSHTDTFGNVVLEALASGIPAVVTPDGGPRYIVRDGETGLVAEDHGFSGAIATLVEDQELRARMSAAARRYALSASWDAVFEGVYDVYDEVLAHHGRGVGALRSSDEKA